MCITVGFERCTLRRAPAVHRSLRELFVALHHGLMVGKTLADHWSLACAERDDGDQHYANALVNTVKDIHNHRRGPEAPTSFLAWPIRHLRRQRGESSAYSES